jgi:hypothetical protein
MRTYLTAVGMHLVWLQCGRPWCRSSRELGKGTTQRAGIWSRAMWRGQPGLPALHLLLRLRPEIRRR